MWLDHVERGIFMYMDWFESNQWYCTQYIHNPSQNLL